MVWKTKPFIYEINTRVWLTELSQRYHARITLGNIPEEVIDELQSYNIDAIWLMGVWTRSKAVRDSALNYMHEYRPVLPDLSYEDVIGSAYAIGRYEVDPTAGGRDGLARFRKQLRTRNIKLILDYVPNHVAVDHPAVSRHPSYFVSGTKRDFETHQGMFFKTRDQWGRDAFIAHGRDPYFPGWIDTAQINAFNPAARLATVNTLLDIAAQCDGVRCDMAMLMVNDVFKSTWGWQVQESVPEKDFWVEVIPQVRDRHPDFLFMAEVYWNMDYTLQQQGFDLTYDKDLYDRLFEADIHAIRTHLQADVNFQKHTVRFIENHDEGRAAASFGIEKSKALATLIATLPGAVLLHDGQFSGRTIKLPVQINRQPEEPEHDDLYAHYMAVLKETRHPVYQDGQWRLFNVFDGNVLAYGWQMGEEYRVIVVNPTEHQARGAVDLTDWGQYWELANVMDEGDNRTSDHGYLHIVMQPFTSKIYLFTPMATPEADSETEESIIKF